MTKGKAVYAKRYGIEESTIPLFSQMYYSYGFDHEDIPVITSDKPNEIQSFNWGLIPNFTDPSKKPIPMVQRGGLNAREDQLFKISKWRNCMKSRRCVVVLDGFFEYHHVKGLKKKVPYHITSSTDETLTLAGIWDHWVDKDDESIQRSTVAIITTSANEKMEVIHNNPDLAKRGSGPRMPAILDDESARIWLDDGPGTPELVKELLIPYPVDGLNYDTVYTLSTKASDGKGNTPGAIEHYDWPVIGLP